MKKTKQPTKQQTKPAQSEDVGMDITELGIYFIRLGAAMIDGKTKVGELTELGFKCGLGLLLKFEPKEKG